jgi:uncharacterized RDD family membrane protein YckC
VTPEEAEPYAGLVTRFVAFTLDCGIVTGVAVVVGAAVALVLDVLPVAHDTKTVIVAAGGVAYALWATGYFVAFWTATGQTPGDRVMRIVVRRLDGATLKPRHALVRLVGILLSLPLLIGFWPILFTERRRGLHDWLAGTVVRLAPGPAGPRGSFP